MGGPTRQRIFGDRVRGARIWRMIKGVLFTALIFAAPFCLVSAQDAKVSVDMMGIGGMSCAHWRSTPRSSNMRARSIRSLALGMGHLRAEVPIRSVI